MFDKTKWQKMSLGQQMGNIGSEVSKAFYWKKSKDTVTADETANRVLELFDLTTSDLRRRFQLTEILRIREVFCDCFFELGNFKVSPESLTKYFIPFAFLTTQRK